MADFEYTLCQKQQGVLIYKLPPISSAQGHYLDNWKDVIWEGGIKVTAKGDYQTVHFINKDGSEQAQCPIPFNYQDAVQKTVDSSRGYAVRLKDPQGKFKWVGVAFRDRNDAFDFNVSLVDFAEKREVEKNPSTHKNEFELKEDLSLKQGQKIKLNLGGGVAAQPTNPKPTQQQGQKMDFGFSQLAWGQSAPQQEQQNQNQFAKFGSFPSQPVQKQTVTNFGFGTSSSQPQQKEQINFNFGFTQKPQEQQQQFQQNQFQQQQFQQPQAQQQKANPSQANETNLLDL